MTFMYLCIQIWFLWKDIDKEDLKINTFINESFFKKNCIYVFSFSVLFMGHEILEGTGMTYAMIYFELLEMMGFICMVLFAYDWYSVLRLSGNKKSLPYELPEFSR
jgi:Na+-driven multidrug efflux pump